MRLFMCVLWALSGMVENGWYLEIARVITTTVKNVKISANAKTNYTQRLDRRRSTSASTVYGDAINGWVYSVWGGEKKNLNLTR